MTYIHVIVTSNGGFKVNQFLLAEVVELPLVPHPFMAEAVHN